MTEILIIIGSIALTALLFGFPKAKKESNKPYKPKKRKSAWDRDPFYGSPLQNIE